MRSERQKLDRTGGAGALKEQQRNHKKRKKKSCYLGKGMQGFVCDQSCQLLGKKKSHPEKAKERVFQESETGRSESS